MDRPVGDGAPGCSAEYELCDDFEGGAFNTAIWTVGGGCTIDTTFGHTGSSSFHAHSQALGSGKEGYFDISETKTLALDDPTFYVRVWVYVQALPANNMELVAADQPSSGNSYEDGLFIDPTNIGVYSQFSDQTQTSAGPAPVGTWFCAIWTVVRTTADTGSLALGGGVGPISLVDVQTDGSPPLNYMEFGIGFAGSTDINNQPAMDVWIDDVIVNNSPITCAD
jgi:hypothetical protein